MATTGVEERGLERTLGTWAVFVAGVGLVVATSTLVSDFVGYFSVGVNFFTSLIIAFLILQRQFIESIAMTGLKG